MQLILLILEMEMIIPELYSYGKDKISWRM